MIHLTASISRRDEVFGRDSGFYASASEVICEGLRLLKQYDEDQKMKLQRLRVDIEEGIASLDSGKGKPLDIEAIKTEGRRRLAEKG